MLIRRISKLFCKHTLLKETAGMRSIRSAATGTLFQLTNKTDAAISLIYDPPDLCPAAPTKVNAGKVVNLTSCDAEISFAYEGNVYTVPPEEQVTANAPGTNNPSRLLSTKSSAKPLFIDMEACVIPGCWLNFVITAGGGDKKKKHILVVVIIVVVAVVGFLSIIAVFLHKRRGNPALTSPAPGFIQAAQEPLN